MSDSKESLSEFLSHLSCHSMKKLKHAFVLWLNDLVDSSKHSHLRVFDVSLTNHPNQSKSMKLSRKNTSFRLWKPTEWLFQKLDKSPKHGGLYKTRDS